MLAAGLRERGHEQLIVCAEDSLLEARAHQEGLRVFALPAHDPAHAHGIAQLRQLLLMECFRVLHAHDGKGQTIAWVASVGMPVRRVASRRVSFLPRRLAGGRTIYRWKYELTCHAIIAISCFVKQILVDSGIPATMIQVIPDGIEFPRELPNADRRSCVRAHWGFGEDDFLIGQMGGTAPEKGHDIAIEALRLLEPSVPRARLLLAGESSGQEPALTRSKAQWPARGTGVSPVLATARMAVPQPGRVHFLGPIENLADFFAGLDLFTMPSRAEGLGSSALLAMAHGVPVVATRVGGLPEVVEHEKTGWLVPAESPAALADAVVSAASDRVRLRTLGFQARERARHFASNIMIERTEALYYRLLSTETGNWEVEI